MKLHRPFAASVLATLVVAFAARAVAKESKGDWIQLFSGRDLADWTPKIKGFKVGDNHADTFRVEDGILKVRYDKYTGPFRGRFGHLFYNQPFSNYVLRIEYRIVGEQYTGGPGWALRNSGVMIHGQSPQTLLKDQDFPVSVEVQFLGGDGENARPTANVCTPGTHIVLGGQLHTQHCTNSSAETYHGDQWVTVEIEVHGNKLIRHKVEGRTVLEYAQPQLDPTDPHARRLIDAGAAKMLTGGTISLQSEGHPIDFRKVELREL
jgi:Domain of Unknown Function (DUF1080)